MSQKGLTVFTEKLDMLCRELEKFWGVELGKIIKKEKLNIQLLQTQGRVRETYFTVVTSGVYIASPVCTQEYGNILDI